jgi:putative membrane protein
VRNTETTIGIILIVVLLVLLFGGVGMMGFGAFGMGPGMVGGYGMMGGYGGPFGFGYNALGGILSLVLGALIIGGIVLLVVWLVRNLGPASFGPPSGESPLDILKGRYAKGEIDKQQYEEMRRDLAS